MKMFLLTLSANEPKNVTHVCRTAVAMGGALARLIICRYTCQDLLCICSEMESRSPEIAPHYYSAPTSCSQEKEDAFQ